MKLSNELQQILFGSTKAVHNFFIKDGRLKWWQKLFARLGFRVYLGKFRLRHWEFANKFYLVKCWKCKRLSVNYEAGHNRCIDCQYCPWPPER